MCYTVISSEATTIREEIDMSSLKIGEKIKTKRRERDLTQEELANILGVSKAAVSKLKKEPENDIISYQHFGGRL